MASLDNIIQQVADFYNVNVTDLMHGDRRRAFSEPRHVAMYLCVRIGGMSNEGVSRYFGKARTIGQYAVEKVADWVNDPRLNRKAAECVQTILWNNNDTKK